MRYRTFEGKSKQEALAQLNIEKKNDPSLREARLIKHTEEEVTSFMGLKKQTIHKIHMAIPDIPISDSFSSRIPSTTFSPIERKIIEEKQKTKNIKQHDDKDSLFMVEGVHRIVDKINKHSEPSKKIELSSNRTTIAKNQEIDVLKSELSNMRLEMKNMQSLLSTHMKNAQVALFQNEVEGVRSLPDENAILIQHIRWAERYLLERDFSLNFIDSFIAHIEKQPELLKNKDSIIKEMKTYLLTHIPVKNINMDEYDYSNTIVFVGPTGVGKTISLIKCAAHLGLMRKKQFRFLLIDRYKMNTCTQLEKLSGYMKSSFVSVNTQDKFISCLEENTYDYTFVDTLGINPNNAVELQEIEHWLSANSQKCDVHLVLSATTKASDLDHICQCYKVLNYNHLLITKIDETKHYGAFLSAAFKYQKSLSFITDGQETPRDFMIADLKNIINEALK